MKMEQCILTAPKTFQLQEVDVPSPSPTQVLLKVNAAGICGSDLHTYHGKHPFVDTPVVLGHEAAGTIVELGESVTSFSVGDRVIIRPQQTCSKCRPCQEGRYNICNQLSVLGCGATGAFSTFFAVESDILYLLPDNISSQDSILIEPLAVGVHALKRGGFTSKQNVLITGAGTIGLTAALAAKAMGAHKIMITDVSDFKLDLAQKSGITQTINVQNEDLKDEVQKYFGPDGLDLIIECSATEQAFNQAIELATKGTTIVVSGIFDSFPRIDLATVQDHELNLVGSLMYLHEDYEDAIQMIADGSISIKHLVTHTFKLSQCKEAFAFIDENKDSTQKVVVVFDD